MDTTGISLVMRVDVQKLHLNVDVCVISGKKTDMNSVFI